MQNIVIDKPYSFIGPKFSRFWLWVARRMVPKQLRKDLGVAGAFAAWFAADMAGRLAPWVDAWLK